jgi:hypothetical protein
MWCFGEEAIGLEGMETARARIEWAVVRILRIRAAWEDEVVALLRPTLPG